MPRIRTIKPKFFDDLKIGKLSRDARLLYIALWVFADDCGVVIGNVTWIKSKVFPYDQIQVQQLAKWIKELEITGFIYLFSWMQEEFIYLPTFSRHQVINKPNYEDLNVPKDVLDKQIRLITEQSRNDTGTIPEQSVPIIGEERNNNINPSIIPPIDDKCDAVFDKFWDMYDKKVGDKAKIKAKFSKLSKSDKEKIFATLPLYKANTPDKKYRKNPETYLNNKSWNDEIISNGSDKNNDRKHFIASEKAVYGQKSDFELSF